MRCVPFLSLTRAGQASSHTVALFKTLTMDGSLKGAFIHFLEGSVRSRRDNWNVTYEHKVHIDRIKTQNGTRRQTSKLHRQTHYLVGLLVMKKGFKYASEEQTSKKKRHSSLSVKRLRVPKRCTSKVSPCNNKKRTLVPSCILTRNELTATWNYLFMVQLFIYCWMKSLNLFL